MLEKQKRPLLRTGKLAGILGVFASFLMSGCMRSLGQEYEYGVEPLSPNVFIVESGIIDVEDGRSVTLTVKKSYPVSSTTVHLVPFSDKELENAGFRKLGDGQCSYPADVDLDEETHSLPLTVSFNLSEEFLDNREYAVGFHLVSDSSELPASEEFSDVIIHILRGKEGSAVNPIKLYGPDDLMKMSSHLKVNAANAVHFKLMNDVDMAGYSWTPLDPTGERPIFFEGCNHTISNLTCIASRSNIIEAPSFFAYLWGTCQNVTFKNARIVSYDKKAGVVAGTVGLVGWGRDHAGHLVNVHVDGGSVVHHANNTWVGWTGQAGGIAGELCFKGSTIEGCTSSATVTSDYCAGGIVGQANDATLIDRCMSTGDVSVSSIVCKGKASELVFLDPSRHGTGLRWGIAGGIAGIAYNVAITNCVSKGEISNTDTSYGFAGGIVGLAYMGVDAIENSWTSSKVTGTENAGGIIGTNGSFESGGNYVKGCVAWNASVSSRKNYPGRVCGLMSSASKSGKASYGSDCYAKTGMQLFFSNRKYTVTESKIHVLTGMNTETGPQYYQGRETGDLIGTTRDILRWDAMIWDFSGTEPRLR